MEPDIFINLDAGGRSAAPVETAACQCMHNDVYSQTPQSSPYFSGAAAGSEAVARVGAIDAMPGATAIDANVFPGAAPSATAIDANAIDAIAVPGARSEMQPGIYAVDQYGDVYLLQPRAQAPHGNYNPTYDPFVMSGPQTPADGNYYPSYDETGIPSSQIPDAQTLPAPLTPPDATTLPSNPSEQHTPATDLALPPIATPDAETTMPETLTPETINPQALTPEELTPAPTIEPGTSTIDPSITAPVEQDSSSTTELPFDFAPTDQPTTGSTTPVDTTAPVDTQTPVDTTQTPVDTQAPFDTTQTPVDTQAPFDTTQTPVDTTQTPVDTQETVETSGTPIEGLAELMLPPEMTNTTAPVDQTSAPDAESQEAVVLRDVRPMNESGVVNSGLELH